MTWRWLMAVECLVLGCLALSAGARGADAPAPVLVPVSASPSSSTSDSSLTNPSEPGSLTAEPPEDASLPSQSIDRWDRHIRGFRREHNFALTGGVSSGTWNVKSFGALKNRTFTTSGSWAKLQYSYHLQLYRGFGYLLGSSAGYHYESVDSRSPFRPVPAIEFPGVLAGLVLNINPVVRISAAFDSYMERHNNIEDRSTEPPTEISVTIQAYDAGVFLDVFYDLEWALRLEAHRRHLDYEKPLNAGTYPVNATFGKDDSWLGLGLLFHLL